MTLSIEFCEEVMGNCDQARTPEGCFTTCNLTGQLVYGMAFGDCPKVQQELAKARTEGRQEAAAELDRSAGQPMQTYIEKQSLMNLLTQVGWQYRRDEITAIKAGDQREMTWRLAQVAAISKLLKRLVTGTPSLIEVEL